MSEKVESIKGWELHCSERLAPLFNERVVKTVPSTWYTGGTVDLWEIAPKEGILELLDSKYWGSGDDNPYGWTKTYRLLFNGGEVTFTFSETYDGNWCRSAVK